MPTVTVTAGDVHYVDHGAGPPVVFLHGVLMNHTQWDAVIGLLPDGFRYVLPDLPLGAHPAPMHPDADLSLHGLGQLIADFLEALDLRGVTLVHSDWGGGLFLTAHGLDDRVGRMVVLPCEAYDNFPPGLPGKMALLAAHLPGGLALAVRQLRIAWLRRSRLLLGWMAKYPIPDRVIEAWTDPGMRDKRVLRDLRKYATSPLVAAELIANTNALQRFAGDVLILWSAEDKVMPLEHGRQLAELIPRARLVVIDDAYALSMLDQPEVVAEELRIFLTATE